ncbi:MAG: asparaginase [Lachnospiraceae bacterium]|nr:asparaginase [Lachnospiraceae bacterium]
MKKIHIIATGGTIAGLGEAGRTSDYNAGQLDVSELISALPPLDGTVRLTFEQFSNVDSNDMTMGLWLGLVKRIHYLANETDVDGFVITHGTDTMDEISYFLSVTVQTDKPVVLTGSMRPASSTSADGLLNLYDSIYVAANDASRGQNVLVCFCGTIYSGRNVIKSSTFQVDAFDGRTPSCLGYIQDRRCFYYNTFGPSATRHPQFDLDGVTVLPRVDVIYYYTDAPSDIIDIHAASCRGLVVCGTGAGNYSQSWINKISALPIPVVRASRVMNGMITKTGHFDPTSNTIPAYTLPPQKARILLSLALLQTEDYGQLKDIFEHS